jgi:hypothetical protein
MKKTRIFAATLVLLTGASIQSMAQSPTIQKEVRLVNPSSGGGYIGLKASPSTSTYTLNMPVAAPTANQVLTVNSISGGAVNLVWNSPDATGWSLSGNTGTSSDNYLGTTDGQPLLFKTNASPRMTIGSTGSVTVNSLSSAAGSASSNANEGVVIADTDGLLSKVSYSSVVSIGLSNSTGGVTVGGPFTVTGLLTASGGASITGGASINGGLNLTGTNPLQLNGASGNAGEILQSNGSGAAPTWSSSYVKGRGVATVSSNESIAVAFTAVDADDAINVTLEGTGADMAIPSYYVVRSGGTGFTIYFSAPFTGSCNWSIINQ